MESDLVIREYKKAVKMNNKRIIPCRYSKIPLLDTGDLANIHQIDFLDKSELANKLILELLKIEKNEKNGINVENDTEEFLKRGNLLQSLGKVKDAREEYKKAVKMSLNFPKDYYDRVKARRVFFIFHYEDIWRVNQVRNSWVTKPDKEVAGFWDVAAWEEVKRGGDEAIKKWISNQLNGTSVTVLLIGAKTSARKWVKYEIEKSIERGNGLLGIYIHNLKDKEGKGDYKGETPFDNFHIEQNGRKVYLSGIYPTYDWVNDDGYNNFGDWIEKAAKQVGR